MTVAAKLDALPLTRLHLRIFLVCALILAIDLGEVALGGALSAVFSAPGRASASQLAWLLAAAYIGGALGAWPVGRLADRFGRRPVICALLCVLFVGSFGSAFSPDVRLLALMRGVTGVALGVLPVIIVAYLVDLLPAPRRGPLVLGVSAIGFAGPSIILLALSGLEQLRPLEIAGWRWILGLGALGALGCAAVFASLPEAPRWLQAAGREAEAERVLSRLAVSPVLRTGSTARPVRRDRSPAEGAIGPRILLIGSLCVLAPVVTMTLPMLNGAVLLARGFSLETSLLFIALGAWGQVLGGLAAAPLLDFAERRTVLALASLALGVGVAGFFFGTTSAVLVSGAILSQAAMVVYGVTLNLYAAELFPVGRRAGLTGFAWGLQRATGVGALFLLVPLLKSADVSAIPAVMLVALALGAGLVMAFGPRSAAASTTVRSQ